MWVAAIFIMAIAMFILLRSLVIAQKKPTHNGVSIEFYHAQISEIELQQKQQLISEPDAEIAKAEAARALLKVQPIVASVHYSQATLRWAAITILVAIPALCLPIYAYIGQPQTPDLPLVDRAKADPAKAKLDELITQIEARIKASPADTRALELIAPLYMRASRFEDAARVLQELIVKLGSSPTRETDLGEALMMANESIISVESYAAFERALKIDPKFNKARYYIGKADEQDGKIDKARGIWVELTNDMPQGSLKTMVEGEIDRLNKKSTKKTKTP
jgi:cytochrome c-type biogenesis protein CcmH